WCIFAIWGWGGAVGKFLRFCVIVICAVTGSTVVIPCEFAYPQSLRVETFMWCHNDVHCEQPTHVCHSDNTNINADYWGRAECLGDRVKNCALKIKDIKDTDAGVYQFGFTSSYVTGISVGWPGVTLQVSVVNELYEPVVRLCKGSAVAPLNEVLNLNFSS
uniref:Immunoglobulin V-set domain-containing protein n=1 Tax=Paramormyrops kingsleyae TaxID=1676925 RepID=A0A3B3S2M4_9TELE